MFGVVAKKKGRRRGLTICLLIPPPPQTPAIKTQTQHTILNHPKTIQTTLEIPPRANRPLLLLLPLSLVLLLLLLLLFYSTLELMLFLLLLLPTTRHIFTQTHPQTRHSAYSTRREREDCTDTHNTFSTRTHTHTQTRPVL